MTYGYARCSTNEEKQDVNRQAHDIKAVYSDAVIISEYEHGTSIVKEQQDKLFSMLNEGDTVVITEVSRLSRSTRQLCELIDTIQEKKVRLVILNSVTIDCRSGEIDAMTKAFLQIAAVFSELELQITRSRVKSGMANAKAKGKAIGRPAATLETVSDAFKRYYPMYASKSINISEFSRLSGLSRTSIYKYLGFIHSNQCGAVSSRDS